MMNSGKKARYEESLAILRKYAPSYQDLILVAATLCEIYGYAEGLEEGYDLQVRMEAQRAKSREKGKG